MNDTSVVRDILIVYRGAESPPRASLLTHLYSFRKYSRHRVSYLNLFMNSVPWPVRRINFDLVIFHYSLLSDVEMFPRIVKRADPLRQMGATRAAFLQDEFFHTDRLCNFINHFGIHFVFSVAPESEWSKIYDRVDRGKVRFRRTLTGYLDDVMIRKIGKLADKAGPRTIDIGYRSPWIPPFWVGSQGLLKRRIAEIFQGKAPEKGLMVDISTRNQDVILGEKWYEFLLRCKYMPGVEGGASVLSRDGEVKEKTEKYLVAHPHATFEEVEEACFPGRDGELRLRALSPRHLEACVAKTCQILVEGEYDGVLLPGRHYIELKRDFSNIDEVLEIVKKDHLRAAITEQAYRDIVESGKYGYREFVEQVIQECLGGSFQDKPAPSFAQKLLYCWMSWSDRFSWLRVSLYAFLKRIILDLLGRVLPRERIILAIRRLTLQR